MANAKPMATPLTVSGVTGPVAQALTAAGAKAGRPVLAVPPGPLGSFPPQTLRPGSAVAAGYSNGDIRTSAVGTVAYVDGDRVWVFGHQLEAAGRRALLLQDAYVFRVVNNPNQLGQIGTTYKLAASGHDLGTVTSDGFSAVAGRTGALPHTVPVQVIAQDTDSQAMRTLTAGAADEAAVDLPSGGSWTSFVAPVAVAQAAGEVLGSTPARMTGTMCARIGIAELDKPLRFCNRYVSLAAGQGDDGGLSNAVLSGAITDLGGALATIDAYTGTPPRVTGVNVLLRVHRGADQAFLRSVRLPPPPGPASACARGSACSACAAAGSPARTRSGSRRRPPRHPARPLRRPGRRPGRRRLHDDHPRRGGRGRRGRRSGPGDAAGARRAGPRHGALRRRQHPHRPRPRQRVPRRGVPHLRSRRGLDPDSLGVR